MCNLYRMTKNKNEVAAWFDAINDLGGANTADEVFPGYPGAVVADGRLMQMSWGFPLVLKGKSGQPLKPKPVNNARTDKLDSAFWRASFEQRRCLIPVTAWAEAEGPSGGKTRSWLSRPDAELFAVAGIWRDTDEWGKCYSMVMTDACGVAAQCHTRMPVLLQRADHGRWTGGTPDEAHALCRPWEGELALDRTREPWSGRGQMGLL
ncbi:SOS response-associated peptidase [Qipengyuania sp. NPDC077563]|uniref:SOS response-associated peptidase n=1 Tax=Qipengyuania sp. NPDC077563 TaxID=3364497 RepID=UPI00384B3A7E